MNSIDPENSPCNLINLQTLPLYKIDIDYKYGIYNKNDI